MDMLQNNKTINILSVKIDNFTKKEILEKIDLFLDEPKFHQIATVNPEFILEAEKNEKFQKILNQTDLNVADGIGVWFSALRFGKILKARIAGADLMLDILEIANQKKMSVFLACKKDGLSNFQETHDAILKIYPDLEIFGDDIEIKNNSYKLEANSYQLVLCNFGAPYQEIFINSQKHANIRLVMGVGGSFDFLTGKVARAPYFMQKIGLEWLWRVFQPQKWKFKKERIKRIFRAVIIFPIKVILNR